MRNPVTFGFISIVLGLTLALGACSTNPLLVADPAHLVTPQQKVDAAINQANASITAAARTLMSAYKDGVYTRDEARSIDAKLEEAAQYTNKADDFLRVGDLYNADSQLKLATSIVKIVTDELVKAKNGSK